MYVNKGTISKTLTETSGNGSDEAVMEFKGLISQYSNMETIEKNM